MANSYANNVPNEKQFQRSYWGTEVGRGDTVTVPTFRMYGDLVLDKKFPLTDDNEYNGTFVADITPTRGPTDITGTYKQNLTYQDWEILQRYCVKGGIAPVSDAQSPAAYTLGPVYPTITRDDLDTFAGEVEFQGMPFAFTMGYFKDFTISADTDNAQGAWNFSSNLFAKTYDYKPVTTVAITAATANTLTKTGATWTTDQFAGAFVEIVSGSGIGQRREVLTNSATVLTLVNNLAVTPAAADTIEISGVFTAGIAGRTRERIMAAGTKVYIDDTQAIGTTQTLNRIISFSVTVDNSSAPKRFLENVSGYSNIVGRGMLRVTGQIRVEFSSLREYKQWMASTDVKIRILQTGATINATQSTTSKAQIDIYRAQWDAATRDERGSNLTRTLSFRGYLDESTSHIIGFTTVSSLSALP